MKISNSVFTILFVSLTTAIAGIVVATNMNTTLVYANHEFAANLTGQEEVPPVDTQALGEAIFVPIQPTNETIDFYVNTTGT
ncbi:MAG TPA: hypothetical protein VJR94_10125, partial [Candidatus Nitrosocosmicus sp.]|nr:hypothetical protein [Candidatus Nitrosocosmicus sp.]